MTPDDPISLLPKLSDDDYWTLKVADRVRNPRLIHKIPFLQSPAVGCQMSGVLNVLNKIRLSVPVILTWTDQQVHDMALVLKLVRACPCHICQATSAYKWSNALSDIVNAEARRRHIVTLK